MTKICIFGAGAIGVEFAYFYHTLGTKITIVELQKTLTPIEDVEIGKELGKIYKRAGMNILLESTVEKVERKGDVVYVTVKTPKGEEVIETDVVLSAVGITGNIENLGLEKIGVKTDRGSILVDKSTYETSVSNIVAIGDLFEGKRPVQRQQQIYAALNEQISSGAIHAVNMKTFTHQEWNDRR